VEVRDTLVRHVADSALIGTIFRQVSQVNYSGIERYDLSRTSGFAVRYSVTSTPTGTDFFLTGSTSNDVFNVGRGEIPLQANPHRLDFIRSRVDVVGGGGTDTLELDDTADTTGDSVRVQPNRINNGPAAPLFDAGGWVNYYSISSTTMNLGSGADTIYAQPSNQDAITVNANEPSAAPGDRLNLALSQAQDYVITGTTSGNVTSSNLQTLYWTGIEEPISVDDVAPEIIAQSYNDSLVPTILVQFSEDVSYTLSVSYLKLTNAATGPVPIGLIAVTYDGGTNTASFTFPGYPGGRLPAGNYTARILPGLPDQFGNALLGPTPTLLFSVGPPLPGDYNQNYVVDAADYTVWRNTLGASGLTLYSGADGSGNGSIGPEDYDVWKSHFGESLPGAGGAAAAVTADVGPLRESTERTAGQASSGTRVESASAPRYDIVASRGANFVAGRGPAGASPSRWRAVGNSPRDEALVAWLSATKDSGRNRSAAESERIADGTGDASGTEAEGGFLESVDAVFELVGSEL